MPFFDPHEQRLCVRVVYDGAAGAGKTTNMHQLASLFASRDGNRVETSYEVEGRTLYFDWLQIRAGSVSGFPLLCQIVSVPGQLGLTPRRRHLLAMADVVVYVCDSRDVERAREGLALLRELATELDHDLPIVLQSNHQDGQGALDGPRLASALDLTHVTHVDAIASEGLGVVDTFVAAVRDLSRHLRDRLARSEVEVHVRRATTRASLLDEVSALEVDAESAAEMLLEEVSASLLLQELGDVDPPNGREAARPPRRAGIFLPTPNVPAGFIWPAHTGRDILRRLAESGKLPTRAYDSGEGTYELKAEGYVFRTRVGERFDSIDAARQALVRGARERAQLGHLTPPDSVLVASDGGDDAYFVWSLVPDVEPLAEGLASTTDPDAAHRWLEAYGATLADVAKARERYGLELSTNLTKFGFRGERLRYLGDVVRVSAPGVGLQSWIAKALADVESAGWDATTVRTAFERELGRRSVAEELGLAPRGGSPESPDGAGGATTLPRTRAISGPAADH